MGTTKRTTKRKLSQTTSAIARRHQRATETPKERAHRLAARYFGVARYEEILGSPNIARTLRARARRLLAPYTAR